LQVGAEFARHCGLAQHALIGGKDEARGIEELDAYGCNVLVATPGT
jgi:superfamily II DNA/RNA helicase